MRRRAPLGIIAICAIAILAELAAGSVATAGSSKTQSSKDVLIGFRMPSNNIFCMYVSSKSPRAKYLRCDIMSGLRPKPSSKGCIEGERGVSVSMNVKGKAKYTCASDTVYNPKAKKLKYGKTWRKGGFVCKSKKTGLKCTNRSRHGFFLSRARSRRF
jgi:hypothetical protein